MTGIVLAAYILGRQHHSQTPYLAPTAFPFSAKLGLSFLLLIYAITHGIAALTVYLNTRVIYTSAQEYFFYIKPARLTGLSHAHLMGIATMDGLVAFLYALTRPSTGFTAAIVTATFAGIFLDIASWWAIKYLGGGYEPLSMISGILFSGGFLMMSFAILHGMWLGTQKRMEL